MPAICALLDSHFHLEYRCVAAEPGGDASAAVLFRYDDALSVTRPDPLADGDDPGDPDAGPTRVLVRALTRRGEACDVHLVAFPWDDPGDDLPEPEAGADLPRPRPRRAAGTARRSPGSPPRSTAPARRRSGCWSATRRPCWTRTCPPPSDADAGRFDPSASATWTVVGDDRDGGFALLAGPRSRVARLYASPQLRVVAGRATVVADRTMPASPGTTLSRHAPIAVRLAFRHGPHAHPAPSPPPTAPPPVDDPATTPPAAEVNLERALREILGRILAENAAHPPAAP